MRALLALLTVGGLAAAVARAGNLQIIRTVREMRIADITQALRDQGVQVPERNTLTTPASPFRDATSAPVAGADFANSTASGIPDTILDIIIGYGCYCNFLSGEFEKAHGRPADGLDQICKSWHTGYFCAKLDDENCLAMEVDYVSVITTQFAANQYISFPSFDPFQTEVLTDAILADCEVANNFDSCKTQACLIDSTFVAMVMAYVMESEVAGQFPIPGTPCPVTEPTRVPEHGPPMECCGNQAQRFPYLTDQGNRACCGDRTYEVALFDCCDAENSVISVSCA